MTPRSARRLGWLVQALALGTLLFAAVLECIARAGGLTLFQYQGY
jgi:hypothetical protein